MCKLLKMHWNVRTESNHHDILVLKYKYNTVEILRVNVEKEGLK
jgi:hypothetical protein